MRNTRSIHVISSGLASGLANHALDRRHFLRCADRHYCELLRFYRSTPTVSVGLHQELLREVRVDYCRANNIEIARRASDGEALYLDPDQLAFSLILRRPKAWRDWNLATLLARFGRAVAHGLDGLGIDAKATTPHSIEAAGRQIASIYVAANAAAVLLHGTLFLRTNVAAMLQALRLPVEKLSRDGLAAAGDRFTGIEDVLGRVVEPCALQSALVAGLAAQLHLRFRNDHGMSEKNLVDLPDLTAEEDSASRICWNHDPHAVEGFVRTKAGTLHARATFGAGGFDRVAFATDTPFEPATLIEDLQDVLQGMPPTLLEGCISFAMRHARVPPHGWNAADVLALLRQLAEKHELRGKQCFSTAEVNALMPLPAGAALSTGDILGRASVMLVPYCAKPSWCAWRHKDGCTECGKCEVSDAYRLARERGMKVVTIVNYEHLETTLAAMKADRVQAFVGMCCRHFLIKRHRAFAAAGLPAVLMDIGGANCYELHEERAAYAGEFTAESRLDGPLLEKIMKLVPESASQPS